MRNHRSFGANPAWRILTVLLLSGVTLFASSCSTAPSTGDRSAFVSESRSATSWFKQNVPGLDRQIADSSGYIIFPQIGQWGILFGGGRSGRAMVCSPDGSHVGWAAINTLSGGLQVGVRGFKMLMVIENEQTMRDFKKNQLKGGISGVVTIGDKGASGTAPFANGFAVYQGAGKGLMAGVNFGLDLMRYEEL